MNLIDLCKSTDSKLEEQTQQMESIDDDFAI